jgi:hypothetical protein
VWGALRPYDVRLFDRVVDVGDDRETFRRHEQQLGACPGVACPSSISNDKNRRDIGKSQSQWVAYRMETPRSPWLPASSRSDANDSSVGRAGEPTTGPRGGVLFGDSAATY